MLRSLSDSNIRIIIREDDADTISHNSLTLSNSSLAVYETQSFSVSTSQLIPHQDHDDDKDSVCGGGGESTTTIIGPPTLTTTPTWHRSFGIVCILLGSLFFSVVTLLVKMLAERGMDPSTASFWRYTGILMPSIPILVYRAWNSRQRRCSLTPDEDPSLIRKDSVFSTIWPLGRNGNWKNAAGLVGRGLIGSTAVILRYYALQYLSVGDMLVIVYASPILVSFMAHIFLGEACGVVLVMVAITTLGGLMLVAKPPILTGDATYDQDTLIGTSYAIAALFCSSVIVIITRKIRKVDWSLMMFVFGVIGVAQAATMEWTLGSGFTGFDLPQDFEESLLVGGLAACAFFGQVAIIMALKYEEAGPVALLRSCEVIFGYFLQYMFLNVLPDLLSGIGATIVLAGVVIVVSRRWVKMLSQESKLRKIMGWVLY